MADGHPQRPNQTCVQIIVTLLVSATRDRCYHLAMLDSAASGGRHAPRSVTRRNVLKYAPALLGVGSLATMFAKPNAAQAAGNQLIDFAEKQISPAQIKAAGFVGVVNYVAEERPGAHFPAKPLTREYADSLRAAGLHIVSNYQYGKPGWVSAPSDYTRGYDGGVADAKTAELLHLAAGGPDSAPILFSIDENIDHETWKNVAVEWLRGIGSVLGVGRTGVYGHAKTCAWAIEDGVIGKSTSPGHWWAWQTRAWSGGVREPRAVLYQTVVNTEKSPGPLLDGINVDVDDVLAPDYGQWDYPR